MTSAATVDTIDWTSSRSSCWTMVGGTVDGGITLDSSSATTTTFELDVNVEFLVDWRRLRCADGPSSAVRRARFLACNFLDSLCTAVTLDETHERLSVSWMRNPCSQIWGPASDWTVLYLNNLWQMKLFHWLIDN
jgi:hypothetical protein